MSGVICDKRVAAKVKEKVYKKMVRPAKLFGLETVALTKDWSQNWSWQT